MSQNVIDLAPYTNTYNQLKTAIDGLTDEQLKFKPAPDKWSITEVLSHLADHSIVFSFRLRKVIAETDVQLATFQQDPWVARSKANEGSAADSLDVFGALLAYNSLLFKRLSAADWAKSGANAKGDTVTVEDAFHAFTRHVQAHLAQIDRIKSAL